MSGITSGSQVTIEGSPLVSTKTPTTASSPSSVIASTVSAELIVANAARKGLVLTNTSLAQRVSVGLGTSAVLDKGITLFPHAIWVMGENTFNTSGVHLISSLGTIAVAVQEFV